MTEWALKDVAFHAMDPSIALFGEDEGDGALKHGYSLCSPRTTLWTWKETKQSSTKTGSVEERTRSKKGMKLERAEEVLIHSVAPIDRRDMRHRDGHNKQPHSHM